MIEFASDNTAAAHPTVMAALLEANHGPAHAYGEDSWTVRAKEWCRQEFGAVDAFPVWNGTGANVTALRAMTKPWQAIICTAQAHINVDECGAPEFLTGCKLIDLPSSDAKLSVDQLRTAVKGIGNEHAVQPAVLSLTQSTEYGTAYSLDQLRELCTTAHALGLRVHLDGSRLANAAVSLNVPLRALTADVGIDLVSFGLTKNGAVGVEVILAFDAGIAETLRFFRKQSTQLASKMRFLSAQILALAEADRWRVNATHANAMASRLAEGLRRINGVRITQAVESNAVFVILPHRITTALQEQFHFYLWDELSGEVRLMCSWATHPDEVDAFLQATTDLFAEQSVLRR